MRTEPNICVAVCRRVSRAAFAVISQDGVYELRCCAAPAHSGHQLLRKAQVLADAYGAQTIVAEPGTFARLMPRYSRASSASKFVFSNDRTASPYSVWTP